MTEIFAHRGAAQLNRENTVGAFVAARELGADGIEFDVRRTVDGDLVVHHDADLPAVGPIAELPSSELPEWIPSLEEALVACRPLQVNVEIKTEGEQGPDYDKMLALEVAKVLVGRPDVQQIVVSSFSLTVLDAVVACSPGLATGMLVEVAEDPFRALETAQGHGYGAVHPFFLRVDEALVRAARVAGLRIRTWTVDDPDQIAELDRLGADAVITNDVPTALRTLGRTRGSLGAPNPR